MTNNVAFYFSSEEDKELYFDCYLQEGYLETSAGQLRLDSILKLEDGRYIAQGNLHD